MADDVERYLTVADVAALCQVDEETVQQWISENRLKVVYLGDHLRIRPDALRELEQPTRRREDPVAFSGQGCPENETGGVPKMRQGGGTLSRKSDTDNRELPLREVASSLRSEEIENNTPRSERAKRVGSHWDQPRRRRPHTQTPLGVNEESKPAGGIDGPPPQVGFEKHAAELTGGRQAHLNDVIEAASMAAQKARAEKVEKRMRKEQRLKNLQGSERTVALTQRVRDAWREEMRGKFGDGYGEWVVRERTMAAKLAEIYDMDLLIAAARYAVRNWEHLRDRLLKGKGRRPTFSFLYSFHAEIVPEAKDYDALVATKEEWSKWWKEHPDEDPPADLKERYRSARKQLEAMGLT